MQHQKKEDSVSIATETVSVSESQQPQEDTTSVISPESLPLPYGLKYDPDVVAEGEEMTIIDQVRVTDKRPVIIKYDTQGKAFYLDFSGVILGEVGDPETERRLKGRPALGVEYAKVEPIFTGPPFVDFEPEPGVRFTYPSGEEKIVRTPEIDLRTAFKVFPGSKSYDKEYAEGIGSAFVEPAKINSINSG